MFYFPLLASRQVLEITFSNFRYINYLVNIYLIKIFAVLNITYSILNYLRSASVGLTVMTMDIYTPSIEWLEILLATRSTICNSDSFPSECRIAMIKILSNSFILMDCPHGSNNPQTQRPMAQIPLILRIIWWLSIVSPTNFVRVRWDPRQSYR
jgi:hypothetical protein